MQIEIKNQARPFAIKMGAVILGVCLSSCGGGSANNNSITPPSAPVNTAPVVSAGVDQTVNAQTTVTLSASASDPDGDSLTYEWAQTAGTSVTLNNSTAITSNFEAPDVTAAAVLQFQFKAVDDQGAQTTDELLVTVNPVPQGSGCTPGAVPQSLRDTPYQLDTFYQKYCDADNIPVLGSALVKDAALVAAYERVIGMSSLLAADVLASMVTLNTRVGIMAETEVTTDIPEHSDLNMAFPDIDWDTRSRGLGATPTRPATSGAEENLLCLSGDIYNGEDIFVHEFAHTVHIMGLRPISGDFDQRLQATYDAARQAGLWDDTYAATDVQEYWAEGVQSWYNVNQDVQAGIHNEIDTRAELQSYDLALHDLIAEYFPAGYQPECP